MKICVLASGSEGNCVFLKTGGIGMLIDCGISKPEIQKRLRVIGESLLDISFVAITHEHIDHTCGLKAVVRAVRPTVILAPRTEKWIGCEDVAPDYSFVQPGASIRLLDFEIEAFEAAHDAANPVAYRMSDGDHRAMVITDLGHISGSMQAAMNLSSWTLIEANHDIDMLRAGPYPSKLKDRVLANHLGNHKAFPAMEEALDNGAGHIVLGHISASNNDQRLLNVMTAPLRDRVTIAAPGEQTRIFEV